MTHTLNRGWARRGHLPRSVAAGVALAITLHAPARVAAQDSLPARLSNAEFWALMTATSESGADFPSDNFTSNEMDFLTVLDGVKKLTGGRTGGVYIGVGPEQNFTYIAALRPAMVFQIDIRRQAILQHLMYKALFELSADRAEFMSRLFSQPRPPGLDDRSSVDSIFAAYRRVPPDTAFFTRNMAAILLHLTTTRALPLSDTDLKTIAYVYRSFVQLGSGINYNQGRIQSGVAGAGTFEGLMRAVDGQGIKRSFLADEANFRVIKDLHEKNLIVPVVGDFGGPKALRAIGDYVKARGSIVNGFYASNVEQYLFSAFPRPVDPDMQKWSVFYRNLGALPFDAQTAFIRSIPPSEAGGSPLFVRLDGMSDLLAAFNEGRIVRYGDVIVRRH